MMRSKKELKALMMMVAMAQADHDTLSILEAMTVATLGLRRAMVIYCADSDNDDY